MHIYPYGSKNPEAIVKWLQVLSVFAKANTLVVDQITFFKAKPLCAFAFNFASGIAIVFVTKFVQNGYS